MNDFKMDLLAVREISARNPDINHSTNFSFDPEVVVADSSEFLMPTVIERFKLVC